MAALTANNQRKPKPRTRAETKSNTRSNKTVHARTNKTKYAVTNQIGGVFVWGRRRVRDGGGAGLVIWNHAF